MKRIQTISPSPTELQGVPAQASHECKRQMKSSLFILAVVLLTASSVAAAEPGAGPAAKAETQVDTNVTAAVQAPPASAVEATPSSTNDVSALPEKSGTNVATSKPTNGNGTNELRMNFRGASLDMVLNYLSEAAGFIINVKPGTSVRGKVDVWSNDPLTKEEALDLLDTVLIQNSLAAIRNGKVLTIVNRDEAKTQGIPVIQGSDPEKIPMTDKIVTQIIPVRFVEVGQLVKDLQPLVSMQTTITANEAGNSIVITDTQATIRKVAEVIHAIDMGAEDVTVVKVFHLQHADPAETADLLTNLFPDDSRSGGNQSPMQFGGGRFGGGMARFFGGGGFGGGGAGGGGGGAAAGGGSGNQNQRLKKRNRVVAVADPRTASVVVTATKDLMEQVESVIMNLDPDPASTQAVAVYHMQNAEPQEAMQVLQDIFNKTGAQNSRSGTATQTSPLTSRSNTQNQQNTTGSRTSTMTPNSRGGGGAFGQ